MVKATKKNKLDKLEAWIRGIPRSLTKRETWMFLVICIWFVLLAYDAFTPDRCPECDCEELVEIAQNKSIEVEDIIEGDFAKREYAEFIMFKKAFQFLDTRLFIKDTKNRFIDESSDSSCLNVNWKHLSIVLNHKRKHKEIHAST